MLQEKNLLLLKQLERPDDDMDVRDELKLKRHDFLYEKNLLYDQFEFNMLLDQTDIDTLVSLPLFQKLKYV
jgi:hypothetical protein